VGAWDLVTSRDGGGLGDGKDKGLGDGRGKGLRDGKDKERRDDRGQRRKKKRGRGKQEPEISRAASVPGGALDHLEHLQQARPEDRVEVVSDWDAEHSRNGIEHPEETKPEQLKTKEDKEKASQSKQNKGIGKLLELGKTLDEPSLESCSREVTKRGGQPGEMEVWKPTKRDGWIEENLWIRPKTAEPGKFLLNAVQREYSRVCRESGSKKNLVLKARQVGMTSYIAARFFVQTVTKKGALTMLVAHDREAAEEIFRIVHRFWDHLPDGLRKGPLRTSHSSARELVFPALDSEFTVASADENAGRGRTIQNLHCTEVSRWGREGAEALASLRAAVVPGGEIVLESTANGAWGAFYQEWQQTADTGYRRHFFPWWFEESYRCEVGPTFAMTADEAALAEAHGLAKEQIAWRRQQWASLRGLAPQEFAEDAVACFRATGECVFELEIVEKALEAAGDPVELRHNGRLAIWLPAQPRVEYVIGVDPAGGGVKGDYSCAQVIERRSGMQCAELHGHFSLKDLAAKLVELGKEYNSALLAVERNNHGAGVLAHLERTGYEPIYEEKGWNGWNTTAVTRPTMLETLLAVMMEKPELFRSARLWNECRTFVRTANGRPEAAPGAHDDCVMAMGIALAVRDSGKGWNGHRETLWRSS